MTTFDPTTVVAFLTTAACIVKASKLPAGPTDCDDFDYFFDHGTLKCEWCSEICDYAEYMGTEKMCERYCPRYLEVTRCEAEEDRYYDQHLDICSDCSQLCNQHERTGNTKECQQKCKAYMAKLAPVQVPSHHRQNSLKAVHDSENQSDDSSLSVHPGYIAGIVAGCVAIVCSIGFVIIVYNYKCSAAADGNHYRPAAQVDGEPTKSRKPVEETSKASDECPHFAIGGHGPSTVIQPGSGFPGEEDPESRVEFLPS